MKQYAAALAECWPERFRFDVVEPWCAEDVWVMRRAGYPALDFSLGERTLGKDAVARKHWAFWGPLADELGVHVVNMGALRKEWAAKFLDEHGDTPDPGQYPTWSLLEALAAACVAKAKDRNPAGDGVKP